MEYVYAALMLHSAGKPITEEAVKKIVTAAGEAVNDTKAKALVASLEGVDITEAMNKAVASAAPAASAAAPAAAAEAPKDEKKSEEEAAGGLASLFG